jgi:alcohol dehydrogenase class IV
MDFNNSFFIDGFKSIISDVKPESVLFVCSHEYDRYGYRRALDDMGVKSEAFTEFEPFPEVSSVKKGVEFLHRNNCDFIVAVGGGSALDLAKGIKYFDESSIRILAVPTTAGTGAEVTRFCVLYNNGDKDSVGSYDIIPEYQVFDHTTLKSLPRGQKIATALDAFCHSVEAYWSTSATDESRAYSKESLRIFRECFASYIKDDESTYEPMMKCSELAGRAINIARTCAPHAFSYKLHKIKHFHHGQAVAICLAYIWKFMEERADDNLKQILADTETMTGMACDDFIAFLASLGLTDDLTMSADEFDETVNGVNTSRLGNTPIAITAEDIISIYKSFITVRG